MENVELWLLNLQVNVGRKCVKQVVNFGAAM